MAAIHLGRNSDSLLRMCGQKKTQGNVYSSEREAQRGKENGEEPGVRGMPPMGRT